MSNRLQKRWIFTWNAGVRDELPPASAIEKKLNIIAAEGVFQLEAGERTHRRHYQGRFKLKGPHTSKSNLLKEFAEIFDTTNLTFQPELAYDTTFLGNNRV